MRITLSEHHAEAAVLGGSVLGGGGGGKIEGGLKWATLAVNWGSPVLVSLDEFEDEEVIVVASAVGAPAAVESFVRPADHIKALELLLETRPCGLAGIIANENGASSGVNGWLQAAAMNLPIVDAPCNGRAHPTGLMGAMGVNRLAGYTSIQAAVGGNPAQGRYLEMVAGGRLETIANMVRYASVQAGGTVAVARDPLPAAYLRKHAAPGATSQAIRLGEAMMAARKDGAQAIIKAVTSELEGRIAAQGRITKVELKTVGGYD
ncbi:MAG: DUF917 family protein, partial [Deltaproteobacteria bacterium]|nr:DUF917 family protein [Deltaproteobacteria bacterium]